jgi:hypothetical protein
MADGPTVSKKKYIIIISIIFTSFFLYTLLVLMSPMVLPSRGYVSIYIFNASGLNVIKTNISAYHSWFHEVSNDKLWISSSDRGDYLIQFSTNAGIMSEEKLSKRMITENAPRAFKEMYFSKYGNTSK